MRRASWLSILTAAAVSLGAAPLALEGSALAASSSASKKTAKAASKKPAKKKSKRSRRRQAKREVSRTPNRRTATNMPRGWQWPPSKSMKAAGARCTQALDDAGIAWKPAPAEGKIVTPILLGSLQIGGIDYHPVFRKPPFPMDCHLALALHTHSPTLHDLGVRKVNFGSIFRYTKVRAFGKTKNVLSRHALGLAMDVVSFEDADGVVRVVENDYPLGDDVLLSVESTLNGSGGFRTVLTPRNDPQSHHDHFHIEADVKYYEDEGHLAQMRGRPAGEAAASAGAGGGEDDLAGDELDATAGGDTRRDARRGPRRAAAGAAASDDASDDARDHASDGDDPVLSPSSWDEGRLRGGARAASRAR